jgi:hypothetical protein
LAREDSERRLAIATPHEDFRKDAKTESFDLPRHHGAPPSVKVGKKNLHH